MRGQRTFGDLEFEHKKRRTRREVFLDQMETVVPWKEWAALITPYYPKGEHGRPPKGIEVMLRMYLLQGWFSLSDEMLEDALYDSQSMRRFVGINLLDEDVPDATTLLKFRHLLEQHDLTSRMFHQLNETLSRKGYLMKEGTIVDATIIAAPSSTKNKEGQRDPEMHQTKKGNQWYFGMKAHIGVDRKSGMVHTVEATAANQHDITCTSQLLHGEETVVYGDAGYTGVSERPEIKREHGQVEWKIALRHSVLTRMKDGPERDAVLQAEHEKASVRAKVEHQFHIVKNLFGFRKVRYRGLAKNHSLLYILFASANLVLYSRQVVVQQGL